MKIGVFGDSFADKNRPDKIWWQHLKNVYKHDVECFGECGSSILFSAQKILSLGQHFDLIIWALTHPGRISFETNGTYYHINSIDTDYDGTDLYVRKQVQAVHDYQLLIQHHEDEDLIGKSLVSYLQNTLNNILIIPCFPMPLLARFNLYQLCEQEAQFYFPNKNIVEIYQDYQDLRPGHLTDENNCILAELVNDNLTSGIFQTEYSKFVTPTQPFNHCFKKYDTLCQRR
jgi:hypothetical protein